MSKKESELEKEQRAEGINATIALLQEQKSEIERSGVDRSIPEPHCLL